jgi:hypothetical protein
LIAIYVGFLELDVYDDIFYYNLSNLVGSLDEMIQAGPFWVYEGQAVEHS